MVGGIEQSIREVHFSDDANGLALAYYGEVLQTSDGGESWTLVGDATDAQYALGAVFILDQNTIWDAILNYQSFDGTVVRKSVDGGLTWTSIDSIAGTTDFPTAMYFTDPDTGWMAGNNGYVAKTVDGGDSWTTQISGTTTYFRDIYFADGQNGWAVGNGTNVLNTKDGGTTWTSIATGAANLSALYGVHFVDTQVGWATGRGYTNMQAQGNILTTVMLHTTDGGSTWSVQSDGVYNETWNVKSLDGQTVWASGMHGTVLRSSDSGTSWLSKKTRMLFDSGLLYDVDFADNQNGWIVGWTGDNDAMELILNTSDGGENWDFQLSGANKDLKGVHFLNADTGWAVGSDGTIIRTLNRGITWNSVTSGTASTLEDVFFPVADTGWAVGASGTILKSVDGGATWTAQSSGTTNTLNTVFFLNTQIGWIGVTGSYHLKTIDGGANWTQESRVLSTVYFADANNGWGIAGYDLRHTTDGAQLAIVCKCP